MSVFNYLEDVNTASCRYDIFIENDKDLRKFEKKLRQQLKKAEKDTKYITCLKEAINAYKNPPKAPKKTPTKVNEKKSSKEDDKFLEEAFKEASKRGFKHQEPVIDKKQQARLQQQKNIVRKEINRRIRIQKQKFIRAYFNEFTNYCKSFITKKNMKIKQFRFIRFQMFISVIMKQWKMAAEKQNIYEKHQERFIVKTLKELRIKQCFNFWKDTMECPLCITLVLKAGFYTTDCGHTFCNGCIGTWREQCFNRGAHATCPNCREIFDYRPIDYYTPRPQIVEQLIFSEDEQNNMEDVPNNMESIRQNRRNIDFIHHNDIFRRTNQ